MKFEDAIEAIGAALNGRGSPVCVGIDGLSGAGKSTLARELAGSWGSSTLIVEGDDFYRDVDERERRAWGAERGYELYFDWPRLRSQVLVPIRERRSLLRYQRYDWQGARMGAWIQLPMPEIVIVEGVYTLRAQLRELLDLKVFVEADAAVRLQRQIARGENTGSWIGRWAAAEDHYIATERPSEFADIVISVSA